MEFRDFLNEQEGDTNVVMSKNQVNKILSKLVSEELKRKLRINPKLSLSSSKVVVSVQGVDIQDASRIRKCIESL